MRNIFLEKLYTKYGDKTVPRYFSEKSKSLGQYPKADAVCFYCMSN